MHLTQSSEITSYSQKPHRMAMKLGNYIESNMKPSKLYQWAESDMNLILHGIFDINT